MEHFWWWRNPIHIPFVSARREQRCAGQRCFASWEDGGGRASISHSSTGNQLDKTLLTPQQPGHFQLDAEHTPTHPAQTQLPAGHCPSWAEFQGPHKALLIPGSGMPYLKSRAIVTLAFKSKESHKEDLRCYNSHIYITDWELQHFNIHHIQLFATETFRGKGELFWPRLCLFDRKTTGLGMFRDCNPRLPTLQFWAPWSFSREALSCPFPSSQSLCFGLGRQFLPSPHPGETGQRKGAATPLLPGITDYSDV